MSPFEYVTVLISIILGLGITQIVTGIADLVLQWDRVKIYWPHLLWIILVFFLQIQEWWETYELRHYTTLRLPTFLFVLLYPTVLFILARILFPLVQPAGDFDLKKFYFESYRKFFLWASVLPVLSVLNNVLVTDHPWYSQAAPVIVFGVLLFLGVRKQVNESIHKFFAALLLCAVLVWLAVMWNASLSLT